MFEVLEGATAPTRGSKYSSCVDLYANTDVVIGSRDSRIVHLGVKIDLDALLSQAFGDDEGYIDFHTNRDHFLKSHCLELKCRSSLPLKKGLIIANGVGEIDLDYPDELGIILFNPDNYEKAKVKKGEKIAQIKLVEHKSYLFDIDSEEERTGGFGSTSK